MLLLKQSKTMFLGMIVEGGATLFVCVRIGKTEEAQADMARLAMIRKNREEAAKKRDEERKGTTLFQQFRSFHELLSYEKPLPF